MFPTDNETKLWVAINLTQRSLYAAADAALRDYGLPSLRWYDILWGLERNQETGLRPFEMEKSMLFEQSNLSRVLRRMVEEGYVSECRHEGDRRGKVLRITDKGRTIRRRMWEVYGPVLHAYLERVSKDKDPARLADDLAAMIDIEID